MRAHCHRVLRGEVVLDGNVAEDCRRQTEGARIERRRACGGRRQVRVRSTLDKGYGHVARTCEAARNRGHLQQTVHCRHRVVARHVGTVVGHTVGGDGVRALAGAGLATARGG